MTLPQFKQMAREQFYLLLLEPEATLAAIPSCCRPTSLSVAKASLPFATS